MTKVDATTQISAQQRRPQNVASELRAAHALLVAGDIDRAAAQYDAIIDMAPMNDPALIQRARLALRMKDGDTLVRLLPELTERAPDLALNVFKTLERQGRLAEIASVIPLLQKDTNASEEAAAYVRQAAARLTSLGRRDQAQGSMKDAVQKFRMASVLDPLANAPRAFITRLMMPRLREARSSHDAGDVSAAIAQLTSIIEDDPRNTESRLTLVRLLIKAGRPTDALPHMEAVAREETTNTALIRRIITIALGAGQTANAVSWLKVLSQQPSRDPQLEAFIATNASRAAKALHKASQFGDAAKAAALVLDMKATDAAMETVLRGARANVFRALRTAIRAQDHDEALRQGALSVEIDPANEIMLRMVLRHAIQRKELGLAKSALDRLQALGFDDFDVVSAQASLAHASGDQKAALDATLRALRLKPDDTAMTRLQTRLLARLASAR